MKFLTEKKLVSTSVININRKKYSNTNHVQCAHKEACGFHTGNYICLNRIKLQC